MIGKPGSSVLVTLAEPKTRYSVIAKAPDKSAQAVTDALLTALQPHADLVHTLTYDNGKEFAYHQTVTEGLDAQGYFAHPYHSWERGLNENTNGLICQYLPKGTDFHIPHTRTGPQYHGQAQQPATEMSWLQDSKSAVLRNQPTCCTYELNPRVSLNKIRELISL